MVTSINIKPNTFYKRQIISKDVSVRAYYGDTYDGGSIAGDISTDTNQKFYIAKSTIPAFPQYGGDEPTINSCYLQYYPNSVSSSNALSAPRLKIYKMKDTLPLTEGTLNVIDENVAAFCSYQDWETGWMIENFAGVNKGFSDRSDYEKIVEQAEGPGGGFGGKIYYMPGAEFDQYMSDIGEYSWKKGGWLNAVRGIPIGFIVWRQSLDASLRLTELYYPAGQAASWDSAAGAIDKDAVNWYPEAKAEFGMKESSFSTYGAFEYNPMKYNSTSKTYNFYEYEFSDRVTQFNSIFNYVAESPDAEDIKVQTVGTAGDDAKFYTYSRFVLESENKMTGAGAGQMAQIWENYSGSDNQYAKYFRTTKAGTGLPQSVHASIDFFPQPVNLDWGAPDSTFPFLVNAQGVAAKEIEFGLKFEKMPPVSTVSGTGGTPAYFSERYNFNRGFFIIFSQTVPKKTDNFISFMNRIYSNSGATGDAQAATGLFFYKERASESIETSSGTTITAISFLDTPYAQSNATPIRFTTAAGDNPDTDWPYSKFGWPLSSTPRPGCVLEFPENEWFTLRFKFNPNDTSSLLNKQDYGPRFLQVYSPDVFNENGTMVSGNLGLNGWPKKYGRLMDINSVSIWANNYRAVGVFNDILNPLLNPDDDGYKDADMEQSILIDRIAFKNFNNTIQNASVNSYNNSPGALTIKPNMTVPQWTGGAGYTTARIPISGNIGNADNYFGLKTMPVQTNLCFGFEDKPTTTGDGVSLLMNNFHTITDTPEYISSFYISGSFMAGTYVGQPSRLSGLNLAQAGDSSVATSDGYFNVAGDAGSVDYFTQKGFLGISGAFNLMEKRENPLCAARVIAANDTATEITVDQPAIFDLPIGSGGAGGTDYIMWFVDEPSEVNPRLGVFSGSHFKGSSSVGFVGNPSALYQLKPRQNSTIYLSRSCLTSDVGGNNMLSTNPLAGADAGSPSISGANKSRLGSVWISPKKWWFNLHMLCAEGTATWQESYMPTTDDDIWRPLDAKSYGPVILVSGMTSNGAIGTFGSTFNEYLFTDGRNQRGWDLSPTDTSELETNTDYGFGVYQSQQGDVSSGGDIVPEVFGGYINDSFPESGTYNFVNLNSYAEIGSPEFGGAFNFTLYPFFEDSSANTHYTINVDNREGSNPPYMIWGMRDDIPGISELEVSPAVDVLGMEDPMSQSGVNYSNVTFSWRETASDVWYRQLFIDNTNIRNKYHNADFWMPLNENPSEGPLRPVYTIYSSSTDTTGYSATGATSGTDWPGGTGGTMPSGGVGIYADIAGFMGYGANFDGNSYIELPYASGTHGSTSGTNFMEGREECTFTVNIKPGTPIPTGTAYAANRRQWVVYQPYSFSVSINDEGKIVASITQEEAVGTLTPSETISLESTHVVALDDVEPVNITVVYNNSKEVDVASLYVNNRLEDTSGDTLTSGWQTNTYGTNTNRAYIGGISRAEGTSVKDNRFKGFIEEVIIYDKEIFILPDENEILFNTEVLADADATGKANAYQAKVFLFDYHNIRGKSHTQVAESNNASWKVTTV